MEGNRIVCSPLEIETQWDWDYQTIRDDNGNTVTVEATISVKQDIKQHSIIAMGELDRWDALGTGSAGDMGPFMEVVRFTKTSDINNRNFERTAYLARYKNVLPPVVET